MVVEILDFSIEPAARDRWLHTDAQVWTAFLETCDGFIRKEVWIDPDDPGVIRVVIWWDSMAQWKAIEPATVAEVDARMGDLAVAPTCCSYEVVDQRNTD